MTIPASLGLPPVFTVDDQFSGEHFDWRMGRNFVRLDPNWTKVHLLSVV